MHPAFQLNVKEQSLRLDDFQSKSPESISEGLPQYAFHVIEFCHCWLSNQNEFIVNTSGSTGLPRSITISRQQMIASAEMTASALNLKPGDSALLCLSTQHVAGLMMLVRGLHLGLSLTVTAAANSPFQSVSGEKFDFTAIVPLQLQNILATENGIARLNEMKAILVGGAPLNRQLESDVQKVNAPVYQTFAMTETVTHIALRRLNGSARSKFYKVLPGVQTRSDQRGCLEICAAVTAQNWVATNDMIEFVSENQFRWLGRIDNIINSGGYKVCPEKVEAALEEIVKQLFKQPPKVMVVGLQDERLGERVVALFDTASKFSLEEEAEIKTFLNNKLDRFERPKEFRFKKEFRYLASGKLDRTKTLQSFLND